MLICELLCQYVRMGVLLHKLCNELKLKKQLQFQRSSPKLNIKNFSNKKTTTTNNNQKRTN